MPYAEIRAQQLKELDELCEKHPKEIPVKEVAAFLSCNLEGLQAGLEKGTVPFGFAYRKDKTVIRGRTSTIEDGRRETVIPTLKFYNWMTGGAV